MSEHVQKDQGSAVGIVAEHAAEMLFAPFGAVNGAHKMLHSDNPLEQVEGGISAFVGGTETAGMLGEGASLLGGLMGEGTAATTIGGIGETLTTGAEFLAPITEIAAPVGLALGAGGALGYGLDWVTGKLTGEKLSDRLADGMAAHQDNSLQQQLGTHFFSDQAQRGTQHIAEHGQSPEEVVHNFQLQSRMMAEGRHFDAAAGNWLPNAQAEPFAHYAQ